MAAAADIQQTGLSTGAEALVGSVVCPIGEQGLGCNKSIQGDPLHLAWTLVDELHRSEGGKNRQKFFILNLNSLQKEL